MKKNKEFVLEDTAADISIHVMLMALVVICFVMTMNAICNTLNKSVANVRWENSMGQEYIRGVGTDGVVYYKFAR